MSKLKRHHINEVMDMHNLTKGKLGYSYVYYADDVDKVIEEKDKEIADLEESHKKEVEQLLIEIAELKEKLKNSRNARKYWRKEYLIEHKELRHSNYKRCLAMAMWCDSENYTACWYHENSERCKWTDKWRQRWLELAEKFKEAK